MAKTPKKKRGAADASSPFVLVRSKTGRAFQRCGIRFEPNRDEPVNLDKLGEEAAQRLLASPQLQVEYVDEATYANAIEEQSHVEQEALDDLDAPALLAENAKLREQVADLQSEIALLTGRRSVEGGGPKENDDKRPKPLMG